MAFCPECGKAVTGAEPKCGNCGKNLPYQATKAGAQRFKGTVMMSAPVVASAAVAPPRSDAPSKPPASAAIPDASPATRPVAHAPNGKNTLLGAGVAPQTSHRPANVAARAVSPLLALQQVPRPEGNTTPSEPPVLVEARPPEPVSATRAVGEAVTAPRIERYLPGDPMAPQQPSAATRVGHSARLRLHGDEAESSHGVSKSERKWLYWAVCAVVLLSALVLTIGLF